VAQDQLVGKAQDAQARRLQPSIAPLVAAWPGKVRSAIGLNHEACFETHEVDDKGPERLLATELCTSDATATEQLPEGHLGSSAIAA
jgi:hypothetical protein